MMRVTAMTIDNERKPYVGYERWKGWGDLFRFTADDAEYYAGECREASFKDASVLEIGFGAGGFLAWARQQGAKAAGIEIIPDLIAAAGREEIELLPIDFETVAGAHENRFDLIVAFDVFEHFTQEKIATRLRAIQVMLRPGGHLILRFPNGQSPFGLAPQHGDPTHITPLSLARLEPLIMDMDFAVVRYGPAFRIAGRRLTKKLAYKLRYLARDFLAGVFNCVYSQSMLWDPVVTLVLSKTAKKGQTIAMKEQTRRLRWRLGRRLYCDARGEVANDIATNGETYVQSCVLSHVGHQDGPITIFDVGANQGVWTSALLRQLPTEMEERTRVFLFEPIPETFRNLKSNLVEFDKKGLIRCFPIAMSNEAGDAEMVVLSRTGGTNSLEYDKAMAHNALERVSIARNTLSAFCQAEKIDHIHFLKCDTEGHDAKVLQGAADLFRSGCIDVSQFEYNHRWVYARHYLKDVFDLLDGLPYRVARIRPDHIEVFEGWHFELERFFEANYLIVHERALKWFDAYFGRFDEANTYG